MKKRFGIIMIFAIMFCMVVGSSPVSAASLKTVEKAYASYLAKHKAPNITTGEFTDAAGKVGTSSQVYSFVLCDLDKDGTPEMITKTYINFRWSYVGVLTYKSGKVQTYKLTNGKKVLINQCAVANGGYEDYICKKKHLHSYFGGGGAQEETIYNVTTKNGSKRMKKYLTSSVNWMMGAERYTKNGKSITKNEYQSLTKGCGRLKVTSYVNNTSTRSKLKNGKCKVSK